VSGRLRADNLEFDVYTHSAKRQHVVAANPQFEIDAGFESEQNVFLVEAKNRYCEDFNIRQLYIPWRYIKEQIPHKPIYPIFLMSHNGVITLYKYEFSIPDQFNSLLFKKMKRYSLFDYKLTLANMQDIAKATRSCLRKGFSSDVVFPQADNFELVIKLGELLADVTKDISDVEVLEEYVPRQWDYYAQAARFLGLVEKQKGKYVLSDLGKKLFTADLNTRVCGIIKTMFHSRVMKMTFEKTIMNGGKEPNKDEIAQWIIEDGWSLGMTTAKRRASTVQAWNRWVFSQRTED
jgi:hypothetical protein